MGNTEPKPFDTFKLFGYNVTKEGDIMYVVYLFKEKKTGDVIYVGSSARPAERMKEHAQSLKGMKPRTQIHEYMIANHLELYRDVEVVWVDYGKDKDEMIQLEEMYYYKYESTLLNDRPGDNIHGWYNPKRKAVRCLNDGKVFKTVTECSRYYGKSRQAIHNALSTKPEYPYTWINGTKYYFEYVNGKV